MAAVTTSALMNELKNQREMLADIQQKLQNKDNTIEELRKSINHFYSFFEYRGRLDREFLKKEVETSKEYMHHMRYESRAESLDRRTEERTGTLWSIIWTAALIGCSAIPVLFAGYPPEVFYTTATLGTTHLAMQKLIGQYYYQGIRRHCSNCWNKIRGRGKAPEKAYKMDLIPYLGNIDPNFVAIPSFLTEDQAKELTAILHAQIETYLSKPEIQEAMRQMEPKNKNGSGVKEDSKNDNRKSDQSVPGQLITETTVESIEKKNDGNVRPLSVVLSSSNASSPKASEVEDLSYTPNFSSRASGNTKRRSMPIGSDINLASPVSLNSAMGVVPSATSANTTTSAATTNSATPSIAININRPSALSPNSTPTASATTNANQPINPSSVGSATRPQRSSTSTPSRDAFAAVNTERSLSSSTPNGHLNAGSSNSQRTRSRSTNKRRANGN